MARIRWTPLALQDLEAIKAYIQRDKPAAARKEARQIQKSVERLARFPQSGRKLQLIPNLHEVISSPYRIIYQKKGAFIIILRIHHGRQKIPLIP